MSPSPKLYEQVAEKIKVQVERGILGAGQKVPSVRRFSRQLGVSAFTVVQAYWVLENQGVLESRPSSGFYVRPESGPSKAQLDPKFKFPLQLTGPKKLTSSLETFQYMAAAITNPANILLSMGIPGLAVLRRPSLYKALRTGCLKPGPKGLEYNWFLGYEPLRRQLARHYLDCGLEVSPDHIVMTSGAVEGLNIAYRMVTRPGDIVAVESPILFSSMCLQHYRVKVLEIPSDPVSGMDLDFLEKALKKFKIRACLAMPNFRNPTGSLMPDERKKRLVEMLAPRGVTLIENDVYGDVHFGKTRPRPAKVFDKTGNVLLVSSFSKSVVPGVRVGWVVAGDRAVETFSNRWVSTMATNTLMEAAMADFMERGEFRRHIRKLSLHCAESLKCLTQAILKYFPEGTKVGQPKGGVVTWVELPEKVDSLKLHKEALAKNIIVLPGPSFCLTPRYKNCVSIGFGNPWSERLEKAIEALGELAQKQVAEKA